MDLADSAHCECGSEEQTPEHILQTCPHLETVRQQFWPEDTEVGTKLWGQAVELQRTADFLAATGLRISTVITSNTEEEEEEEGGAAKNRQNSLGGRKADRGEGVGGWDLSVIFTMTIRPMTRHSTVFVEIVYIEQIDWIDLDCSRKLSIVLNVSLLTLRHA